MKIKIIDNIENGINNSSIRWQLSTHQIWIGDAKDYAEVEALIPKTYGSFKWLFSDSQTLLFDRNRLIFMTAVIDIMGPIEIIKQSFEIESINNQKGTIQLVKARNFDCDFTGDTKYYYKEDVLISYNKNLKLDTDMLIVRITNDFGFIIKEDEIVGWILSNASNHIGNEDENLIDSEIETSICYKEILVEFLILVNLFSSELNDIEEEKLKNDLEILYERIKNNNKPVVVEMKEAILNMLDFMAEDMI